MRSIRISDSGRGLDTPAAESVQGRKDIETEQGFEAALSLVITIHFHHNEKGRIGYKSPLNPMSTTYRGS